MNQPVSIPVWVVLLLALAWYLAFVRYYRVWMHWLIHKLHWGYGAHVTWRRPSDNVLMVGKVCPMCGLLHDVHPAPSSYKRMMRGERYY